MRKILLKVLLLLVVIFVISFVTPNMVLAQTCIWVGVENARINSHQPGQPWCPPGHFLTALDLDGPRNYSAHDSPVVGQALCSSIAGSAPNWSQCNWVGVEVAGINSHQPGPSWCPSGAFLVALDLDGPRNYSAHDSPIVGQAMCCSP